MEDHQTRKTQVLYVGDARNTRKRILNNHRSGNVESSVLRKHIALMLGLKIRAELRTHGSYRIRIDAPDTDMGEKDISEYIRLGRWRAIIVDSYEDAHELQWYAIEELCPPLNRRIQKVKGLEKTNCEAVFRQLMESPLLGLDDISELREGPGVYIFYNTPTPE